MPLCYQQSGLVLKRPSGTPPLSSMGDAPPHAALALASAGLRTSSL